MSSTFVAIVLLVVLSALWMDTTERANQRAAIQACWNKGGVPVFAWYSVDKLADCRFPLAK